MGVKSPVRLVEFPEIESSGVELRPFLGSLFAWKSQVPKNSVLIVVFDTGESYAIFEATQLTILEIQVNNQAKAMYLIKTEAIETLTPKT